MFQRLFRRTAPAKPDSAARVDPSERIYAVGDIHGRLDLLEALLARITEDAAGFGDARCPRFIFLGDYVDRGDHSAQVLDFLAGLTGPDNTFLMGNHEAAMLAFLDDPLRGQDWLGWGGRQTLTSYGISPGPRVPDTTDLRLLRDELAHAVRPHLPFLQGLARHAASGDVIFAHASLDPTLALEDQPDAALLWGQVPSGQPSGMPGHRLVHGHFDAFEPVSLPARLCVDTGAFYSGRLTAARLDGGEAFLHVDAADLLD